MPTTTTTTTRRTPMAGNATVVRQLRGVGKIAAELGVRVFESPGWTTRGRSSDMSIDALLCHHTAAPVDVDQLLIEGRPDLIGPLCNESLHGNGDLVLIASGRANHAGVGILPSDRSAGLEVTGPIPTTNTGPDAFPDNYDAYVKVAAAHCIFFRWPADLAHVPGHKETARPVGRKINPAFDMSTFRLRVADVVRRYQGGDDMSYGDWPTADRQSLLDDISRMLGEGEKIDGSVPPHIRDRSTEQIITEVRGVQATLAGGVIVGGVVIDYDLLADKVVQRLHRLKFVAQDVPTPPEDEEV
jgi:hypothetical protein